MALPNRNIFSDSVIEPLFGLAAIVVSAGPSLAAGYSSSFFVDAVGSPAGAGNVALVEGDTNLQGGVIPQGQGFELYDLSIFSALSTYASAPTEAALIALGQAFRVRMHYADTVFELGPLALFLGPYGGTTGSNNVVQPRPLAFPAPGRERGGFVCEPAQPFKVELKSNVALTAGVATSTTYLFRAVMNRRIVRRGASAIKQ